MQKVHDALANVDAIYIACWISDVDVPKIGFVTY